MLKMEPLKQETSNKQPETPKASNRQLETVLPILGALLLAGGWAPWPTVWLVPLLFIGWVPYLLMERELTRQNARKRRVFALTYLFLVLWNALTTWWVSYAEPTAGAAAKPLPSVSQGQVRSQCRCNCSKAIQYTGSDR